MAEDCMDGFHLTLRNKYLYKHLKEKLTILKDYYLRVKNNTKIFLKKKKNTTLATFKLQLPQSKNHHK